MVNVVNAERVSVQFGTRLVLDEVSLGVADADVVGVVGRQRPGQDGAATLTPSNGCSGPVRNPRRCPSSPPRWRSEPPTISGPCRPGGGAPTGGRRPCAKLRDGVEGLWALPLEAFPGAQIATATKELAARLSAHEVVKGTLAAVDRDNDRLNAYLSVG
jgi:hypothetical protein